MGGGVFPLGRILRTIIEMKYYPWINACIRSEAIRVIGKDQEMKGEEFFL